MDLKISGSTAPLLDVREAAQYLGVTVRALIAATNAGYVRCTRRGRNQRAYLCRDLDLARQSFEACVLLQIVPAGALAYREAARILGIHPASMMRTKLRRIVIRNAAYYCAAEVRSLRAELDSRMTLDRAAAYLGRVPTALYRYEKRDWLHPLRFLGRNYYCPAELERVRERLDSGWSRKQAAEARRRKASLPHGYLSISEAAARLGVVRNSVHGRVCRGTLSAIRIGGCLYVPSSEVEEILHPEQRRWLTREMTAKRLGRSATAVDYYARLGMLSRSNNGRSLYDAGEVEALRQRIASTPPAGWITIECARRRLGLSQLALGLYIDAGLIPTAEKGLRFTFCAPQALRAIRRARSRGEALERAAGAIGESAALELLGSSELLVSYRRNNVLTYWEEKGERFYWKAEIMKVCRDLHG